MKQTNSRPTPTLGTLVCLILWALSSPATAQQFTRFGEVDVHYAVVNTSFLEPQVAAAYGITRGKRRAIVNISILEADSSPVPVARSAIVSGRVRDLISAPALDFMEIREQNAIYYIADFHILDKQLHRFEVDIQLDPNQPPYQLRFEQKVYAD
jgi:hypothetical protein